MIQFNLLDSNVLCASARVNFLTLFFGVPYARMCARLLRTQLNTKTELLFGEDFCEKKLKFYIQEPLFQVGSQENQNQSLTRLQANVAMRILRIQILR